jgi:hypothetical protein
LLSKIFKCGHNKSPENCIIKQVYGRNKKKRYKVKTCRECKKSRRKKRFNLKPENFRKKRRELRRRKIEKYLTYAKNWRENNRSLVNQQALNSWKRRERQRIDGKFGPNAYDHYEFQRKKQKGLCAICRKKILVAHRDHSHFCCDGANACGKCLRGLLCSYCNLYLGRVEEIIVFNPRLVVKTAWLKAAIIYVRKWQRICPIP